MLVPAAGAPATTHVYFYRCVGAMNSLTAVDLNGTGGAIRHADLLCSGSCWWA